MTDKRAVYIESSVQKSSFKNEIGFQGLCLYQWTFLLDYSLTSRQSLRTTHLIS